MKPLTVDEYIAQAPEESQAAAKELRKVILEAAPKGTVEKLSYGMPYYGYHGRLIYWGVWKDHLGVYIMDIAREALAEEIAPYHKSKATLHFPLDKPLPKDLIEKMVTIQAKGNEERSA